MIEILVIVLCMWGFYGLAALSVAILPEDSGWGEPPRFNPILFARGTEPPAEIECLISLSPAGLAEVERQLKTITYKYTLEDYEGMINAAARKNDWDKSILIFQALREDTRTGRPADILLTRAAFEYDIPPKAGPKRGSRR